MPTPDKQPHPLTPRLVRERAKERAVKRWPLDDTYEGEVYREAFAHGYRFGVAHAEAMIAKHGERR